MCYEAAAVVCAPCLLAREEGKEESRPEGTDDGELEEEEERGEDKLEDEELSPPDHIAGAPMERDRCLNMVSVCVCCVSVCVCTICVCTRVVCVFLDGDALGGGSCKASKVVSAFPLVWLSSRLEAISVRCCPERAAFDGCCLASVWVNNKTTALLNSSLSVLMHLLPFQQQFVPICLLPFVCVHMLCCVGR